MLNERLIEHRNATLDIYCSLVEARQRAGKNIPKTIIKSHKNLEEQRFLLAIVGKVKAGKSTFINALLNEDLLPTDALQSTAAIIEIFYSEKPFLRVTYANNASEEVFSSDGDDTLAPLSQKLREVAAIQSNDRELPIAQLNDFIIEQYDPSSKQAEWDPAMLDSFIEVDLPKLLELAPGEWQQRSKSYLETNRTGARIAKRVEVGFPSDYQFDHFRVVDTPGICAKGGFAERTLQFLNNADAVIYLHKDEPSEKSLHDALQNIIPEKAKRHMLLVLTHKCERDEEENHRFLDEAMRTCSEIPSKRIFLVDSLTDRALQAFYHLSTWAEIADFRKKDTKTHRAWKKVTAEAFEDAAGNRSELLELLEKQSNMRELKETILQLSEMSLSIQIETLVCNIMELYRELEAEATAQRDLYGEKLKDPQQFSAAMIRKKHEMDDLKAESAKRVRRISIDFDLYNHHQNFGERLDKIINNAVEEVNGKEFAPDDTAKTADDFLSKVRQEVTDKFSELLTDIELAFKDSFKEMEFSLQLEFKKIAVPIIPLTVILDKVREESTETKTRNVELPGFWNSVKRFFGNKSGWTTEEYKALNAVKFFSSAKSSFLDKIRANKLELAQNVKVTIDAVCDSYSASVSIILDQRREFISKLEEESQANEDIRKCFEEESSYVEDAKRRIEDCVKIKGGL